MNPTENIVLIAGGLFILLLVQPSQLTAQTNSLLQDQGLNEPPEQLEFLTNYAHIHNLTLMQALNSSEYQSNYYLHIHGITEQEAISNMISLESKVKPNPWPDLSLRRQIFKRCAEALLSAIDTNQIELAVYTKMTNQPAIRKFINPTNHDGSVTTTFVTNDVTISDFSSFMSKVMSDFGYFGALLNDPNLNSYIGTGYRAQISDPTNFFYFDFWAKGNPPVVVVQSVEKRTLDATHVLESARFYGNGKLQEFRINLPNPESATFDVDGNLISYRVIENNMAIDLRADTTGKIVVRGFLIKGK